MGSAAEDRAKAATLPEGDVVRVLLEQHARVRDLFSEVTSPECDHRQAVFDELRAMLAVHETAEQMVLRPVTSQIGGGEVADARTAEETEANEVLAELEKLDVGSADFETRIVAFEKTVDEHAEKEEEEEFSLVLEKCHEEQRRELGQRILTAESMAPTHPHPSTSGKPAAQFTVGPIAAVVDRVRDALGGSGR